MGAFGDLTADAAGAANTELLDPPVARNGVSSMIGRAVMVRAEVAA